jgi:hypothetical protein
VTPRQAAAVSDIRGYVFNGGGMGRKEGELILSREFNGKKFWTTTTVALS